MNKHEKWEIGFELRRKKIQIENLTDQIIYFLHLKLGIRQCQLISATKRKQKIIVKFPKKK